MARTKKIDSAKSMPKKKAVSAKSVTRKKTLGTAKKKKVSVKSIAVKTAKRPAKKKPVKKAALRKVKPVTQPVPKAAVRKSIASGKSKTAEPLIRKASIEMPPESVKRPAKKSRTVRIPAILKKTEVPVLKATEIPAVPQPVSASFFQEVQGTLPAGYGDHFISLMICSPYQLYAYWEIQKHQEQQALQILGGRWDCVKSVLRVYNLTQDAQGSFFFDQELAGGADRWFINVEPDQSYRVEIGLRHADGRFIMLARSNDVTTPRVSMSDVLDEHWMGIDFDRMYALSGGFETSHSSDSLKKLMDERLRFGDTSGSGAGMLSSGSLVKQQDRHFWFTLNCELVVYGATAPDAHVTMNGQSVALRPDGTFTLRYPLPDGKIRLEAKAFSADLIEERTITPTVQRRTERPEPVIRRDRGRG